MHRRHSHSDAQEAHPGNRWQPIPASYRRVLIWATWFVIALACRGPARGSELVRLTSDYLVRTWQTEAGLPQNSVSAILQSREGYLWVGTFNGLVRFDGVQFKTYTVGNSPGLISDGVVTLYEDRASRMWIGTDGGGLACLQGEQFTSYPMTNRVGAAIVSAIAEDQAGRIWIGTDGGLYRLAGSQIEEVKPSDANTRFGVVQKIACDPQGTLWMSIDGTLWTWSNDELRHRSEYGHVYALSADDSARVWFFSQLLGLVRSETNQVVSQPVKDDPIPTAICAARNGDIWQVAASSLRRDRHGLRTAYALPEDLIGGSILTIFEDREQNLWLGSNGRGLIRLREKVVETYTTDDGLPGNDIVVLAEDQLGRVWMGGFGTGAGLYDQGRFHRLPGLPAQQEDVISLGLGRQNRIWLGTRTGDLFRWQDGQVTKEPPVEDGARIIFETQNGALWLGTRRLGVEVRENGRTTRYTTREGLSDNFITGITQTPDQALWVGTKRGLNRIAEGKIASFGRQDGLGADCIHTLYMDSRGVLWVGTAGGGLSRFDKGRFFTISAQQGLPNEVIAQIIEDGLGSLWIGSNAGVFRVDRDELLDCAAGRLGQVHCQMFNRDDGLANPECAGSFQPSCVRTRDGKLWFATVGGPVVIDPTRLVSNPLPPPVYVNSVTADGVDYSPLQDEPKPGIRVVLPPGRSHVEIHYTALSYVAPEANRFRYRLQGLDREWTEAGSSRRAPYNRLPPGQYRFEVNACNNDGLWNASGAALSLVIQPFWWQTLWFQSAAFLALTLSAAMAGKSLHRRSLDRAVEWAQQRAMQSRAEELGLLNAQLQGRTDQLEEALANVKTLRGMIPICSHCKKVRTDDGYWHQVEAYVQRRSDAKFSHGLCPECIPLYFPRPAEPSDTPDEP